MISAHKAREIAADRFFIELHDRVETEILHASRLGCNFTTISLLGIHSDIERLMTELRKLGFSAIINHGTLNLEW